MSFGITRLLEDLKKEGFEDAVAIKDRNGLSYALIPSYEVPAGAHAGRKIELAIPAPPQYPQQYGASIQVRSNPILYPIGNVPNVRNVVPSPLDDGWLYWSFRFTIPPSNPTPELLTQINGIFRKN